MNDDEIAGELQDLLSLYYNDKITGNDLKDRIKMIIIDEV